MILQWRHSLPTPLLPCTYISLYTFICMSVCLYVPNVGGSVRVLSFACFSRRLSLALALPVGVDVTNSHVI